MRISEFDSYFKKNKLDRIACVSLMIAHYTNWSMLFILISLEYDDNYYNIIRNNCNIVIETNNILVHIFHGVTNNLNPVIYRLWTNTIHF
jgi:hypothetical protein